MYITLDGTPHHVSWRFVVRTLADRNYNVKKNTLLYVEH